MGIYIHIPFCVKKCNYCDFLSFPADDTGKLKYVESLIERIKYFGTLYSNVKISTIFFGGGTPSILPDSCISRIMTALKSNFDLSECSEITIECNPGTVDFTKLSKYKNCGINRISFGLQSTNNDELKFIGRIHTYENFLESYNLARKVGFTNINIDIMSALPYQTYASYKDTLTKVLELKPEHISSYSLILEEGTPMYDVDTSLLPDEDTEREMYYLTDSLLKEYGYHRYEISNYSLSGYECKHNSGYWTRIDYLGIGIGSASLVTSQKLNKAARFTEIEDINLFCKNEYHSTSPETLPSYMELSFSDAVEEFMYLGLRMTQGISTSIFKENFGYDIYKVYGDIINSLIDKKLLEKSGDYLRLTTLGIDVSNQVLAEFLEPDFSEL